MSRRISFSILLVTLPAACWISQAATPEKPNVLLIMADDLGYECLGAYGGTSYRTPNLDSLARTGMRFDWCFSTPLCSPSRIKLMTGRYGFRNYRGWGVLDEREYTFGHLFRDNGYATCISGKWQLCKFDKPENADHPRKAGFDNFCVWTWVYRGKKPSRYWNPFIWQDGRLRTDLKGAYGPDVHCRYVLDFIRRNKDRPFFVYYPTNLVHAPFVPPPGTGDRTARPDRKYFPAMVNYLDRCVGKVVALLDELGLREKTLILFTGDNGTPRGIRSRLGDQVVIGGKGTMTDAGTHVPLIANWPGVVPAGSRCRDLIDFSDFFPTFADLINARTPKDRVIDGRSFLPQLKGKSGTPREAVYWYFNPRGKGRALRAVRNRRYKYFADGRLFDLKKDPRQRNPLPAAPQYESIRGKLEALLRRIEGKAFERLTAPRRKRKAGARQK